MADDPQHILRDSNGNDLAYFYFDSNNNAVIEHADTGEQAVVGSDGFSMTSGDFDSTDWDDYELQKDGSDAQGVINFKTA